MIEKNNLIIIGKTIKPHGISGAVLCEFTQILEEEHLPKYFLFEIDGIMVPFFIQDFRRGGGFNAYISFEGVAHESEVKLLCDRKIFSDKQIKNIDDSDQLSIHFLVGFKLIDNRFGLIGEIAEVDDSTINTLFVVEDKLIPAQEAFIEKIDADNKIIYTNIPEGLLDI